MPEICRFFGIVIHMYFDDHNPPHFHVEYQDCRTIIGIRDAELLEGYLPAKQLKLVQAWTILREEELLSNFRDLGLDIKQWRKIDPLL
ncbi:DUF4160 domain-containing protein [Dyadobacter sandarakinus]|uniref:DUF4160 domain-containing protein n=1 Tax=Dyadobacter sandarakinus TaxID=2747268 RepID=A0ABX7IAQ7_9BACT|nr:DUF4160 domain-containing protein [Dyadobacter sandarakinus]QRR03206.1 DUF4160 domain-containing protein [Dyadobacter sandarakinus]